MLWAGVICSMLVYDFHWMMLSVVIIILFYRQHFRLANKIVAGQLIRLSQSNATLVLENEQQSCRYQTYRLFINRWFIFLRLLEGEKDCEKLNLFLCRHNFESAADYASIRRQLIRTRANHAAGNP